MKAPTFAKKRSIRAVRAESPASARLPITTATTATTAGVAAGAALGMAILAGGCNAISGLDDLTIAADNLGASPRDDAGSKTPVDSGRPPFEVEDDAGEDDAGEVDASKVDAGDPPDADVPVDAGDDDAGPASPLVRRVFVTSSTTNGNLGGLGGADTFCNNVAKSAGLGAKWFAWLSTPTVDAIDRVTFQGAHVLLDGTVVAKNKQQFTSGKIEHAIDMMEDMTSLKANHGVWTGTRRTGLADATCNGWTTSSSSVLGTLASAVATDGGWTKGAPQSGYSDNWECSTVVSLYCFER